MQQQNPEFDPNKDDATMQKQHNLEINKNKDATMQQQNLEFDQNKDDATMQKQHNL